MHRPYRITGYSLYELIMTLGLVSLVIGLGLPSFGYLAMDSRLRVEGSLWKVRYKSLAPVIATLSRRSEALNPKPENHGRQGSSLLLKMRCACPGTRHVRFRAWSFLGLACIFFTIV